MTKEHLAAVAIRMMTYSDEKLDAMYPGSHLEIKMRISAERIRRQKATR